MAPKHRVQDSSADNTNEVQDNREVWQNSVVKMRGELTKLEAMLVGRDDEMASIKREKDNLENLKANRQHEIAKLQSQLRAQDEETKKLRSSGDRRARELVDLKRMVVERDNKIVDLNRENEHLRRTEIANLQSQLRVQEEEIQKLQTSNRKVGKELDTYRDAHNESEQAKKSLHEEIGALRHQVADTNKKLGAMSVAQDDATVALKRENEHLENLRTEIASLKNQLRVLNAADSVTGGEVVRLVEKLNQQILDWAAHLAYCASRFARVDAAELEKAREAVKESLGDQFFSLFQASRETNDPEVAIQIALQASLAWFSCTRVSQWHQDRNLDDFLRGLYSVVQQSGMSIQLDVESC
jgi:chromosome segregation ATPase